jgi:hypothetical protein
MAGSPAKEPVEDKDKRHDERFTCRSPVEWTYFNKPESYSAQMRNFSSTGACFESSQELVRGATILVRLESYQTECRSECVAQSECPWPRSIVLGEVKWCRNITGSGLLPFGVGVKFHLPP